MRSEEIMWYLSKRAIESQREDGIPLSKAAASRFKDIGVLKATSLFRTVIEPPGHQRRLVVIVFPEPQPISSVSVLGGFPL